jgi:hypothetical protein
LERAEKRAIAVSLRGEKFAAMEEFFEIYQRLEAGASKSEPKDSDLMERLWIARNKLQLIGSDQLQEPLNNVAYRLDDLYSHGPSEGESVQNYMQETWRAFRLAARKELRLQ